jgi:ribonuclease HI
MEAPGPHFLLYAEASVAGTSRSRWKFVLQAVGGDDRLIAADAEPQTRPSRLELLAVVRGLEALDQPSRVTLVTRSRYVSRGLRRELNHWRDRRWRWERFGKLVPIRDHDLWQRVDRALKFHQVDCCAWHDDETRSSDPQNERRAMPTARHGHEIAWGQSHSEPSRWRHAPRRRRWTLAATMGRLRHNVLSPISAICRPAFTRAA